MANTHTKKITAFMSVVAMLLSMLLYFPGGTFGNMGIGLKASAATITPTEPSKDGNGVYQIGTAAELYWFADKVNNDNENYVSASAALIADIIVNTGVMKSDGALAGDTSNFTSWMPIGNSTSNQYTGTFDGKNHTISGLYFNNTNTNYVGLFGYLGSGCKIKNVDVIDSCFIGRGYVGGVCGNNYDGTITGCFYTGTINGSSKVGGVCGVNYGAITYCYSTGIVSGTGDTVGGVCGENFGTITECCNISTVSGKSFIGGVCGNNSILSTITDCCNTGKVNGTGDNVGGVCGVNDATMTGCCNTGTVNGRSYVGGVCGYNDRTTITCCYSTGAVSGTGDYVGGVCGDNAAATITNCYNTGAVSGPGDYVGGVCGYNRAYSTISLCYYDSDKYSGDAVAYNGGTVQYVKGKPTADFTNCSVCKFLGYYEWPAVNASGVYEITNACQLYWFSQHVNGGNTRINAVLIADITVNTGVLKSDGTLADDTSGFESWTPIGNNSYKYTGTFDGQGHTVRGLYFDDTDDKTGKYVGLFGSNSGTIKNVGVVASYFNGCDYVGAVCGDNSGTITNCYNTGNVSGSYDVGGVSGWSSGTITGCYSTGKVSGQDYIGGMCGYNYTGIITNCYNTGNVSGTEYVGGVCGYINGGTITNCYNSGKVSGTYDFVGGVCGNNGSGKITNCHNIGNVNGSGYVGSLCGSNDSTITNCYFDSGNAIGFNQGKVTDVESKTTAQFASGEVAYLLNGSTSEGTLAWGQTLGKDNYPVLDSTKKVYYGYISCSESGIMSYSNTELPATIPGHTYNENGFCAKCGVYEPAAFSEIDNRYIISNAGQLYWFAQHINGGNTGVNAVLTADITVNTGVLKSDGTLADDTSGFRSWTPIGNSSKKYTGKFDGQGHTISGLYCNISTSSAGLFGCLDYGEIKNVGVIDSYFNGSNYVGGVCAWNYGGKITACYNTGTLKSDSSVGGVCGWNLGGKITGCYSIGTVNGSGSVGGVCGIKDGTITGCYTNRDGDTYYKPNDEFTNGTVCGLLNTALQNVNPDAYFYQGANYPVLIVISNLPKLVDGVYQISNEKELYAFAQLVNSGAEPSANAVITADIIVNTGVLKSDGTLADDTSSFTSWTPIGNSSNKYTGSFNGQNHTVSGLYFNNTSTSYVGLFGRLGSGGEIRNTGVIDSYFRGYSFVGGICGENNSGTITDCYNTGTVSSSYNYAGGVCAVNRNTITGCYNTGRVSGRSRVGGVSGWNGNSGTIIGCYNTGTVSSSNNYVGGVCGYNYTTITGCYNTGKVSGSSPIGAVCGYSTSTGTITNCYFDRDRYSGNAVGTNEGTATDVEGKATAQFASGEVAYLLNGSTSEGTLVWGQTIGTDSYPVLGGAKVYQVDAYAGCEGNPGEPSTGYANVNAPIYAEHSMTEHSANAATCTATGNYAYWTCSREDGVYYKDEAGTETFANLAATVIPASGHDMMEHPANAATCTEPGNYAYWTCSREDGVYYKDAEGTETFASLAATVISASGHEYTSGGICKSCSALENGKDGFKSASLTLTDGVILNYYLLLSQEALADSDAYIHFTSAQGLDVQILLSEGTEDNGKYKFSLELRPDQMADVITAKVVYGDGSEGNCINYSVQEYAENVAEADDSKALVDAMLKFGAFTQLYTGKNTDNLAIPVSDYTTNASIAESYKYTLGGEVPGISVKGATLQIGAYTTIRLKYQLDEGADIQNYSFKCGETVLEPEKSGEFYFVYLRNIRPQDLDEMYSFTVSDGTNTTTFTYSAFTYMKHVLDNAESYDQTLVNLVNAMYEYHQAAEAYLIG